MRKKSVILLCCITVAMLTTVSLYLTLNKSNVSCIIEFDTLTDHGCSIVVENSSKYTLQYGDAFGLEEYTNGQWQSVETEILGSSDCTAYYIRPGEKIEINVNWAYRYGKLKPGNYRVVKYFEIVDSEWERLNNEERSIPAYAEFRIWF